MSQESPPPAESPAAPPQQEPQPAHKGVVRPCERAPGKFEVVFSDNSVHPYAFRTEAEAQALLDRC